MLNMQWGVMMRGMFIFLPGVQLLLMSPHIACARAHTVHCSQHSLCGVGVVERLVVEINKVFQLHCWRT